LGLRYEQALIDQLLQGVRAMEESVTYQAIFKKGNEKGFERGIEKGIEEGGIPRHHQGRAFPAAA
jgi:predicted transposase YdaD